MAKVKYAVVRNLLAQVPCVCLERGPLVPKMEAFPSVGVPLPGISINRLKMAAYCVKKLPGLFTSCICLIYCQFALGQAPDIKTDSSFALLTAAGAFGNTGSTIIWGDVGTHVGAYTGSQTVMGNVHVADPVSAQAALDLDAAYTYMSGLTCDSTIVAPLGGGLVLVPGRVYCVTTASALDGDLILDAKGNPNGIFDYGVPHS